MVDDSPPFTVPCAREAGRALSSGSGSAISQRFRFRKRQAEAALPLFAAEVANGRQSGANGDVGFLLDKWIDPLELVGRSAKTIEGYRSLIRARLKPALANASQQVTPADLDRFYRALLASGLSPTSVRHCQALCPAVKWDRPIPGGAGVAAASAPSRDYERTQEAQIR